MKVETLSVEASRRSVIIEGLVIADPFGGRYEDRVAVHAAERWAEMARNAATAWAVARGDTDEDVCESHDGCVWSIRRQPPLRLSKQGRWW
jgi:hypothetical protein